MPVKIKYTDNGDGIEITGKGVVTGQEIITTLKKVYDHETFKSKKYEIIDRTNISDYRVSNEEVRKIADMDVMAAKTNPGLMVAIISTTDLQYGITRMYQGIIGDRGFKTKIFQDRRAADEWIDSQLKINLK